MRTLFIILLLAVSGFCATGDITAVSIDTSGWFAHVTIEGLDSSGTFDFGTVPASAKVVFNVTSPGYDDNCDSIAHSRTVYGTNYKRKVYPGSTDRTGTPDWSIDAGNVVVTVALHDPICSNDISTTVDMSAGFYTQGGTPNNAVSEYSATNNSLLSHSLTKVIANWSWYDYRQIGFDEINFTLDTSGTFKLKCQAYHYFGDSARPVRAVRFMAADQHGNADTQIVLAPTIDTGMIDAVPVIEYIGVMSTDSLTNGDLITCNFEAYPWYGIDSSTLKTSDGVNSRGSPLYAPMVYLNDKDHTYGNVVAVVDSATGNNATATVVPFASFDSASPPNAYETIAAASNAIIAYNNTNYGHNDNGGGIILMQRGTYVWTGATATRTSPAALCIVQPFPGVTREQVVIATQSGSRSIGNAVLIKNVTWNYTSAVAINLTNHLVTYNNVINHSAGSLVYSDPGIWWIIGGDIEKLPQGLKNPTGYDCSVLSRGYTYKSTDAVTAASFLFTGIKIDSGHVKIAETYLGEFRTANPGIVSFFKVHNDVNASVIQPFNTSVGGGNYAIVQGLIEVYGSTAQSPGLTPANYVDSQKVYNNILIWNVTNVGQRVNCFYNDFALNDLGPAFFRFCQIKNCLFDDINMVTDYDVHGGTPDADKRGNHAQIHGCGLSGNLFCERTGAAQSYVPKYSGINSIAGVDSAIEPDFVSDKSMTGDSAGFGDYRLQSTSPAIGIAYSKLLPYDLAGVERTDGGASGAYEYESNVAPTISTQPVSDTVRYSGDAQFIVTASGSDPKSYIWYQNGDSVGNSNTLTISSVTMEMDGYEYFVIVTNEFGADTSDTVALSVYWPTFTIDTNIVGSGTLQLNPAGLEQDSGTTVTFMGTANEGYAGDTSFNITLVQDTSVTVTFLQHPVIDSIRNNPEYYGERISIYGSGFLSSQGIGFIVIEGDTLSDVEMWTDTHIIDTIPADMERGHKELQINNNNNLIRSAEESLRVLRPYVR